MTFLYLIRHARSTWNAEGRMQGQADPPLDDVGREQARALAERLRGEPFRALYSSPLARARQTAEIAFALHNPPMPIAFDNRLKERDLGEWTGLTIAEVEARYPERVDGEWRVKGPPGGESRAALVARAAAVFAEIFTAHPEGPVAVVSHGGLLNAYVAHHLLGVPLEKHVSLHLPNTAVARLDVRPDRVYVLSVDAWHLDHD